ncbi:MAG TPA: CheR family methyltransferase [Rectinemataceae bacterium]|nr:CheR family methyltransferase [Rectinemataceae bacterium]
MDESFLSGAEAALESFTGIRSQDANRAHFRRVILKHAAGLGLSPERYVAGLPRDETALRRLVNAVAIGETYFFREARQFKVLRDHVIPRLRRPAEILRCWSASCSTGEEAVSMATLLAETLASGEGAGFELHASDINDESLDRFRSGVFPRSSFRKDGEEFHPSLERRISGGDHRSVSIDPSLLASIFIHRLNLSSDPLDAIPNGLDLILLRNTLLYMSQESRDRIVDRVASRLREGGVLFLATSEIPFVRCEGLRLEERDKAYFLVRDTGGQGREALGGAASATSKARSRSVGAPAAVSKSQGPATASDRYDFHASAPSFDQALALYDEGRIMAASGDVSAAAGKFGEALEADPSFWPARFRGACLDAALSKRRARRGFERCIADMDLMDDAARERFAAVLDDFNSAYFRRMCERWIERLDGSGGRTCR